VWAQRPYIHQNHPYFIKPIQIQIEFSQDLVKLKQERGVLGKIPRNVGASVTNHSGANLVKIKGG
jgi:hypothetical protein